MKSNMIMGTPQYLAPENITGIHTPKSDIWCCGIILYALLRGSPPFKAATRSQVYAKIRRETINLKCILSSIQATSGVFTLKMQEICWDRFWQRILIIGPTQARYLRILGCQATCSNSAVIYKPFVWTVSRSPTTCFVSRYFHHHSAK